MKNIHAKNFVHLILAGLLFASCTITREAQPVQRTVTVTETGSVTLRNDQAVVTMAVETRNTNPQTASEENLATVSAIRSALSETGIPGDKVKTLTCTFEPNGTVGLGRNMQTQYLVTSTVAVLISDITKPGAVIDAATKAGATKIQSVSYSCSAEEQGKKQARLQALNRAEETANTIASANGFTLGKLLSVEEQNVETKSEEEKFFSSGESSSAGLRETSVTVRATYELN